DPKAMRLPSSARIADHGSDQRCNIDRHSCHPAGRPEPTHPNHLPGPTATRYPYHHRLRRNTSIPAHQRAAGHDLSYRTRCPMDRHAARSQQGHQLGPYRHRRRNQHPLTTRRCRIDHRHPAARTGHRRRHRTTTGYGETLLSLLTSVPLAMTLVIAPVAPWIATQLGRNRVISLALIAIAAGTSIRSLPGDAALITGTLLLGLGIAVGTVLLP